MKSEGESEREGLDSFQCRLVPRRFPFPFMISGHYVIITNDHVIAPNYFGIGAFRFAKRR